MRKLWLLLLSAGLIVGCSKEKEPVAADDSYVYEPVRMACAYISIVEKPDATRVLLLGEEAKTLAPVFEHAGVQPFAQPSGKFDIVLVTCDEMSVGSCTTAANFLTENGVMVWAMDMDGVTAGKLRSRIRSFAFENAHLWMPGEGRWLLVGRKSARQVKLSAMLDVFAREGTFYDLEKMRCGTLPALFANYVGVRADFMPAFAMLESKAFVRPANFLTSKVEAVDWISSEGLDADMARDVLSEIRSMQVVRRLVVEGNIAADLATDKKGEERATDLWSRAGLRNPNDLFLLERVDRLERNAKGFLAVGKVLPAMKCYETIVLMTPNDASAVHNFGMCLKKIGKLDLAKQVLERAEKLTNASAR